jgi:hypothetical protein
MPAPVKGMITEAAAIISPSFSTPLLISEAITANSPGFLRIEYNTQAPLAISN